MTIGTKSVLFGAHAFWLHPLIVAMAWFKLHRFKCVKCPHTGVCTSILDPRLWLIFIVHDLGYISKPDLDGSEGELHPLFGGKIVNQICDNLLSIFNQPTIRYTRPWYRFSLYHSRFLAKRDGVEPSIFCAADKMAIAIEPSWLYLPRTKFTGELDLYMKVKPREVKGWNKSPIQWHKECKEFCHRWAIEHKNGEVDHVTSYDA